MCEVCACVCVCEQCTVQYVVGCCAGWGCGFTEANTQQWYKEDRVVHVSRAGSKVSTHLIFEFMLLLHVHLGSMAFY